MSSLWFGDVLLGDSPQIIGVVDQLFDLSVLEQLPDDITLLEIRVDQMEVSLQEVTSYVRSIRGLDQFALLLTIRETNDTRGRRAHYFEQLMPYVDAIDIDVSSANKISILELAAALDRPCILSHHDYEKTPSKEELLAIYEKCSSFGADIVKIAAFCHTEDDVQALLDYTQDVPSDAIITIGMGAVGQVTRSDPQKFSSLMTYGCIDKPVAPGQLSVMELASLDFS